MVKALKKNVPPFSLFIICIWFFVWYYIGLKLLGLYKRNRYQTEQRLPKRVIYWGGEIDIFLIVNPSSHYHSFFIRVSIGRYTCIYMYKENRKFLGFLYNSRNKGKERLKTILYFWNIYVSHSKETPHILRMYFKTKHSHSSPYMKRKANLHT